MLPQITHPLSMWDDELRDTKSILIGGNPCYRTTDVPCMILRGRLFIGPEEARRSHVLDYFPMDAILSLGHTTTLYDAYKYPKRCVYHHIVLDDSEDEPLTEHLDDAVDFIHTHIMFGNRVLVHCQAGVSRSAAICIAYLMKYQFLSYKAAHKVVKIARDCIYPNEGFVKQLLEWEKTLL